MFVKVIKREDAASIFYNDAKMKTFYKGNIPTSVTLKEVHSRLETILPSGKLRKVQGIAKY